MLNWDATKREVAHIIKIMDWIQKAGHPINRSSVSMDLEAAHSNGCRLRFGDMANGKMSDVLHDVNGICGSLDRKTGKLKGGFAPRFAA